MNRRFVSKKVPSGAQKLLGQGNGLRRNFRWQAPVPPTRTTWTTRRRPSPRIPPRRVHPPLRPLTLPPKLAVPIGIEQQFPWNMTQPVTLARDDDVGVVIINNPPVNALSHPVRAGIKSAIAEANLDPAIAALVIYCEGRTFIAGADIREFGKPLQPPGLDEIINEIENSAK